MKAIVVERYGRLEEREVPRPTASDGEVLVRVRASSVNALEWYMLTGRPWLARPMTGLRRPRSQEFGSDFAGVVEAVGEGVTGLATGDEVYGSRHGALAEYVVATAVERKPTRTTTASDASTRRIERHERFPATSRTTSYRSPDRVKSSHP